MNELLKQHYEAIVKRGLITDKTKTREFIEKIFEECWELSNEYHINDETHSFTQEAIDIMAAAGNMLIHLGYDVEQLFKENINYQKTRRD